MLEGPSQPLIRSRHLQDNTPQVVIVVNLPEDDEDSSLSDKIYVDNNCQVSNDPPIDGEIPDLKLCNYKQFLCLDSDEATSYQEEEERPSVVVTYQYELYYNPEADFERLLQYFEEASLEHMAAATGTLECSAFGRRRLRRLQGFSADQLMKIGGVGREPTDLVDDRFDGCIGGEDVPENTACVPMLGGFTVFLNENAEQLAEEEQLALKESVRGVLRSGMETDLYVSPGNIEKVAFVESREPSVSSVSDREVEGNGSGASSTAIGLMSGAAALLVLIIAFLLATFRRSRSKREMNVHAIASLASRLDEAESLDGSLADQDSLALAPQFLAPAEEYPDDDENGRPLEASPPPGRMIVVGRALGPAANSDLGPQSTFEGVYITDDETARTGEAMFQSRNLSNLSEMERSVIAEAESGEQEYISEVTPRPVMKRYTSEEYSLNSEYDPPSEDYETASEDTPRRALQMS